MELKNLIMVAVGIVLVLILIGSLVLSSDILKGKNIKNSPIEKSPELEKYRSENIPENCRLPVYESDINSWKEHLSHHQKTLYCLDYYETSIEELNGDK